MIPNILLITLGNFIYIHKFDEEKEILFLFLFINLIMKLKNISNLIKQNINLVHLNK